MSLRRRHACWVTLCLFAVLTVQACGSSRTPTPAPRTPTSVPTVTPTATPSVPWPLTGLPAENAEDIRRPALAIKISNSAEARPQSGLQAADVVFEHLSEAGITRFTAIFHSQVVTEAGSVRSARLIDLEIPAMYGSALVFSGASGPVLEDLYVSDFSQRLVVEGDPGVFRKEGTGKAWEHTLFVSPADVWVTAEKKQWPGLADSRGMRFDIEPPDGGRSALVARVPYSSLTSDVTWEYDADRAGYLRSILGAEHLDALTGEQIAVRNVVVLYVNHVQTLIVENEMGGRSIEIQLWGSGQATVLRGGQAWDVQWSRPGHSDAIILTMSDGQTFPLEPGNTWYELVPLDMQVTME
jgi:hypothetical protein